MARIPIGMEYESTVEGDVLAPFACKRCGHTATASVKSKGRGEATAVAFIGTEGAKSRAAEEATADLLKNATALAQLAPCPKCGAVDEEAVAAERSGAFGKSALLCVGFIALMLVFPTRSSGGSLAWLVPIVGVVAAFVTYRKAAWRWEEAAERVRFGVKAARRSGPSRTAR